MTLSEITLLGKPSVLIPFPYAADNHQEYNARALEKKGAASLIIEKNLTEKNLQETVMALLNDKQKLDNMASNSKKLGVKNAAEKIGCIISELLGSTKK
jgi:UDP-N-acetylglucosamine--N-acetylmuramyl-(pentapeptide) pyrophosphoryl-undecaprenol N-acetylglucosamine transferase